MSNSRGFEVEVEDMTDPNDPKLKSFIDVDLTSDFPIQNLPYGVFATAQRPDHHRIATRIGDWVVDLGILEQAGLLQAEKPGVFSEPTLNTFMGLGKTSWHKVRRQLSELLQDGTSTLRDNGELRQRAFFQASDVIMQVPARIGDYTDFYSSKEHASNVGAMFRDKDNPLLPNWTHLPVGYHGRASSVVASGCDIVRPMGQVKGPNDEAPRLAPCARLDFELEMAFFVGPSNQLGRSVPISNATDHIFGLVLMNDWSARDVQKWEYVPLGPFTAKNFATSISPWIVTMEALEPFRVDSVTQDPQPLDYLQHPAGKFAYDIGLAVDLKLSETSDWHQICSSNARYLYWSMAQQLTHHTITGCNLQPGDLMASGTISGSTPESRGSMLELSWGGKTPLQLGSAARSFLEDGDTVRMRGYAQRDQVRIGFGEVTGRVLPAQR